MLSAHVPSRSARNRQTAHMSCCVAAAARATKSTSSNASSRDSTVSNACRAIFFPAFDRVMRSTQHAPLPIGMTPTSHR